MPKRVVVIDNYDSFTYNLVQYLESLGAKCQVHLSDGVSVEEVAESAPDGILLSPGPGTPDDAGITLDLIRNLKGQFPMLGVCLGHQSIARAFGARVVGGGRLLHGKTSRIEHDGLPPFDGLPNPLTMARYNSLLVDEATLPEEIQVSARSEHGEVMGVRHRRFPVYGVQFHPESILSERGRDLMHNWLNRL
jgi:anthranilate synthase/aminodeoxychorismate synthase-like glutamine amidotransferase